MGHPKKLLDLTAAEQEGLPLQVVCPTCGKSVNPEDLTIDEIDDEELVIESVSTANGSLLTSQGISKRFHIPVKIIDDLARREVMPHYHVKDIDQSLFHRVESKEWIRRNLFQRVEGGELVPSVIKVYPESLAVPLCLPPALAAIFHLSDTHSHLVLVTTDAGERRLRRSRVQ